jgi:hypothetical protein
LKDVRVDAQIIAVNRLQIRRPLLRRQDSNLNSQNQNLMCCRLHHDGPRISGEPIRSPSAGHAGHGAGHAH